MAQVFKKLEVSEAPVIPDRLYFKIGDVARICAVETYVLRFWETQFPQLKPNKSGTGQRLYRRREVELALDIKRLVHAEGYTIAGAKQVLDVAPRPQATMKAARQAGPAVVAKSVSEPNMAATIGRAKAELREILSMLDSGRLGSTDQAPSPGVPHLTVRTKAKILRVKTECEPLFP